MHDPCVVGQVIILREVITGEDLSRYLNKIESIGLRKLSASAISAI